MFDQYFQAYTNQDQTACNFQSGVESFPEMMSGVDSGEGEDEGDKTDDERFEGNSPFQAGQRNPDCQCVNTCCKPRPHNFFKASGLYLPVDSFSLFPSRIILPPR